MKNMHEIEKQEEYEKELKDHAITVIDFFTTWCGPCKMLSPTMEEMSEEYDEKTKGDQKEGEKKAIGFFKVDCDKMNDVADTMEVKSVPTIIIFKDGKEYTRLVGLCDKDKYVKAIDACKKGEPSPGEKKESKKTSKKKK